MHDLRYAIGEDVTAVTGDRIEKNGWDAIGGGCINQAFRLKGTAKDYFVKVNHADRLQMFEAEADGLRVIAESATLRVPAVICTGVQGDSAWLVLEHLELGGTGSMETLGEGLAAMHRATRSKYGWHRDNTIGSTPQQNREGDDWVGFWQEQRLGFQLRLAARNGYHGRMQDKGERLMGLLPALLDGHQPEASLVHGDLWSGNYAMTGSGEPVIFDPAVYYGDRETDLAMTELFGGFGGRFYQAYRDAWPLDGGYPVRKTLYNLYHILNHLNLFGGGYLSQAEGMMDRLIAEAH